MRDEESGEREEDRRPERERERVQRMRQRMAAGRWYRTEWRLLEGRWQVSKAGRRHWKAKAEDSERALVRAWRRHGLPVQVQSWSLLCCSEAAW